MMLALGKVSIVFKNFESNKKFKKKIFFKKKICPFLLSITLLCMESAIAAHNGATTGGVDARSPQRPNQSTCGSPKRDASSAQCDAWRAGYALSIDIF